MGRKFYRYSPTTSEISMSESFAAVMHPVLGLLHYTPGVPTIPNESLEEALHG